MRERPDAAIRADGDSALDHGERLDHGVATDRGAAVDIGIARVDDADALGHPVVLDPRLHNRVSLGKMLSCVDAKDIISIENGERQHVASHRLQEAGRVGEVILALGVAGVEAVERAPEDGKFEDIATGIDLAEGALIGCAVAFLDDFEERAVGIADDPAESVRVGDIGGAEQRGDAVGLLAREEFGERAGTDERFVADEHERRAGIVAQHRAGGFHGVAGAELAGLRREEEIRFLGERRAT